MPSTNRYTILTVLETHCITDRGPVDGTITDKTDWLDEARFLIPALTIRGYLSLHAFSIFFDGCP